MEAPEVIVIGAKGMLGNDVLKAFGGRAVGVDRDEVDITDTGQVSTLPVSKLLINCAAYTDVDGAEEHQEEAWAANVLGVRNLVRFCRKNDIPLVHFSTDYVFDGVKEQGYDEDDLPRPLNYYGITKAESERIVLSWEKHFLVRTSWLYGRHGKNFVETVLSSRRSLTVVDDQRGKPTYTRDLAQAVLGLVRRQYGVYHITNEGVCTWYELAVAIRDAGGTGVPVLPCATAEFPRPARRPVNSVLNNNKTEKLRHWKEALAAYMEER